MCGLDFLFSSSSEFVIVSEQNNNLTIRALELLRSIYSPNKVVILKGSDTDEDFELLLPFTKEMKLEPNSPKFYICSNYVCNQPVNSINELERSLLV